MALTDTFLGREGGGFNLLCVYLVIGHRFTCLFCSRRRDGRETVPCLCMFSYLSDTASRACFVPDKGMEAVDLDLTDTCFVCLVLYLKQRTCLSSSRRRDGGGGLRLRHRGAAAGAGPPLPQQPILRQRHLPAGHRHRRAAPGQQRADQRHLLPRRPAGPAGPPPRQVPLGAHLRRRPRPLAAP